MDMRAYVDEVKLKVTGGVLNIEIDDGVIGQIVNSAMREMQRYICSTRLLTVPYKKCIDLSSHKVNSVARVYRATGIGSSNTDAVTPTDPVHIGLLQLSFNSGNMHNLKDYAYNYGAYNTMQQVHNTVSTDLSFYYEDDKKLLYINTTVNSGTDVTIEYVPRYDSVDEIKSDFWIDVLVRLSTALTKIALGRIRSRFTQSNALWQQDGPALLQEGQAELSELRAYLQKNTNLVYPID